MVEGNVTDPHPIVVQMGPSGEQLPAVLARGRDVAVTAGAGAGKTRTLVARYLSLLAEDVPLRGVVAITFTKKAAREMRNRVRDEIRRYLARPDLAAREAARWQALYAGLDAARIDTIHALCAEILRGHPAEAGLDPRFAVLEEGPAALLRGQALDEALAWAASDPEAAALFGELEERDLRKLLGALLEKRLAAAAALAAPGDDPLAYWAAALGTDLQTLDREQARRLPLLRTAFDFASRRYAALKEEAAALDFDDLEAGARDLLSDRPNVLARWQAETRAILVDEFQDTNGRQRDLVRLLNRGSDGGKLFIVGDAKQSIYRFRGADVAVFREERVKIAVGGGAAFALDRSYRAHRGLVQGLNDLLRPVLGETADAARPWVEPFAPLDHFREEPAAGFAAPHIALHLTVGSKSDGALQRAAAALASTLAEMVASGACLVKRDGETTALRWDDIAVLCRAAGSFPPYEDAFEAAGIPYLTVAGGGFYDRPEIRDLLNALAALADPRDDLALAGLLRSPACALSDAALYQLTAAASPATTLWARLQAGGAALPGADGPRAPRAADLIARLHALAGRVAVADLLKAFLDATDYLPAWQMAGQSRAVRNIGKLLADAQASSLVNAGAFLDYLALLKETGAREGEARAAAEGAVQIMSVHQAKGLEFSIVVIGDAAYDRNARDEAIVDPRLGVLLPPGAAGKDASAVYAQARAWDRDQEDAESRRLLYVAATRAQELLIFSACVQLKKNGMPGWLRGWLKKIAGPEALNLTNTPLPYHATGSAANRQTLTVAGRTPVACVVYEDGYTAAARVPPAAAEAPAPATAGAVVPPPLLAPVLPEAVQVDARTATADRLPAQRVWRVVPAVRRPRAPAWVVGSLVHEALAAWRFPDADFDGWAAVRSRGYGLTDAGQIADAVAETRKLLLRFRQHPLYAEMAAASRRLAEVPYSLERDGRVESGVIDALYGGGDNWTVVEFKTDDVRTEADLADLLALSGYRAQAERYAVAVQRLLGQRPRLVLCLLDYGRSVFRIDS